MKRPFSGMGAKLFKQSLCGYDGDDVQCKDDISPDIVSCSCSVEVCETPKNGKMVIHLGVPWGDPNCWWSTRW